MVFQCLDSLRFKARYRTALHKRKAPVSLTKIRILNQYMLRQRVPMANMDPKQTLDSIKFESNYSAGESYFTAHDSNHVDGPAINKRSMKKLIHKNDNSHEVSTYRMPIKVAEGSSCNPLKYNSTEKMKKRLQSCDPPSNRNYKNQCTAANSLANSAATTIVVNNSAVSKIVAGNSNDGINHLQDRKKSNTCDKCDGNHPTDSCPHYKKVRDKHPDAQKNNCKKFGGVSNLPGKFLDKARIVRQPGDGSCLFHSMSFGLKDGSTAKSLRTEICKFIMSNPNTKICLTPLSDWIKWDTKLSCYDYALRMSKGSWGGGIEMACVSKMKNCNIHVYQKLLRGYKRISAFDCISMPESKKVVRVLYQGRAHYDALQLVNS